MIPSKAALLIAPKEEETRVGSDQYRIKMVFVSRGKASSETFMRGDVLGVLCTQRRLS